MPPDCLRRAIAERSDSIVVEQNGRIAGFANFYRWESGGACAIGNVIVAPSARRTGVARFLIGHMIALALTKHRAGEVTISCFNENIAGLLLYPKLGFEPFAIEAREDMEGRRVALVHMRLPLRPE